jgi:hypothetical protein
LHQSLLFRFEEHAKCYLHSWHDDWLKETKEESECYKATIIWGSTVEKDDNRPKEYYGGDKLP